MRTIASFREEGSGFYLPRAKVDPPEALQRQIWPKIDGQLQKYAEFDPHAVNNAIKRPNLAEAGFLRLLKYLRRVILQDSVILRDIFPDHPIWKHFVFHTDQYAAFREQILVVLKDKKDPANVQIKTALPLIANRMNMNIEDIKTTVLGKSKKVNNRLPLSPIKSLGYNRLYKGLSLKIKEFNNINNISYIYKNKVIYFKVNKGSK